MSFGGRSGRSARDAPLLADGGDQPAVARIDAQRHLQLHVAQAVHVRQRRLQVDISTDIGEGDQRKQPGQDDANAGDEN